MLLLLLPIPTEKEVMTAEEVIRRKERRKEKPIGGNLNRLESL